MVKLRERWHRFAGEVRKVPAKVVRAADYATNPETKSVIPSLILFYVLCVFDGWYNAFVATVPTQVLEAPLNDWQYNAFVLVTLIAPLFTLVGMCLRKSWAYTGAIMQLAGNLGVAGVLWTFIAAIRATQYWGQGNFAGTWVLASAIGAVVFIVRDIRRLSDRDRWIDQKRRDR